MIPQTLPKATIDEERAEIDKAIARVLDSGWYVLGPEVERFEAAFAAYIGVNYAVGVANGTDAIELSLRALGVGPGDVVATVSHTAVATVAAIRAVGAEPLWIDIDPVTCLMDTADLAERIEAFKAGPAGTRLKAVIAVHLYGAMVPPEPLLDICHRHDLLLIEDCAQAHGATWRGRPAGSFGHAASFSFYPTKNLGAVGDGGALVTSDANVAEQAMLLRQYGWKERYISYDVGTNSRLDSIQAAILSTLLERLDERNARRRTIAQIYENHLSNIPQLGLPKSPADGVHVYHQYVIQHFERDKLALYLKQKGIGTAVHYPVPVHQQEAYIAHACSRNLPHTEEVCKRILSLPMFPQLEDSSAVFISNVICEFFRKHA